MHAFTLSLERQSFALCASCLDNKYKIFHYMFFYDLCFLGVQTFVVCVVDLFQRAVSTKKDGMRKRGLKSREKQLKSMV